MVLVVCPYCGGKGSTLGMGEETCWKCCGTGRDMHSDLWAFPCPVCNGRCKLPYCRDFPCGTCRGTGHIEQNPWNR